MSLVDQSQEYERGEITCPTYVDELFKIKRIRAHQTLKQREADLEFMVSVAIFYSKRGNIKDMFSAVIHGICDALKSEGWKP